MRIAVSFDGTIVENRYPDIGREKRNAIKTLRRLAAEGNDIILWTARSGIYLEEAVEWCRERHLFFYAVNSNHPEYVTTPKYVGKSPKIVADLFIDSHNVGGLPSWDEIYEKANERRHELHKKYNKPMHKKISLWGKIALAVRGRTVYQGPHVYKIDGNQAMN